MGLLRNNMRLWAALAGLLSFLSSRGQLPCAPQVNLGSNINFCSGNTLTLSAFNPNSTYLWSTGATSPSISVSTTGSYWVVVTNSCGSATDTIDILTATPLFFNLGPDQTLCSGSSLSLSIPFQNGTSYLWSTGSTSNSISVNNAGTYWLRASNACGIFTDTIVINYDNTPNLNLGPNRIVCLGTSVNLNSGSSSGTRLWSDGSTGNSLSVNSSGTYWVELNNACGVFRDSVSLTFVNSNQIFTSDILSLCAGNSLNLGSNLSGSYLWNTGATSTSISITSPGLYWLEITDGCVIRDSIFVRGIPVPNPNIGNDTTLCAGQSLNITDSSSGFTRQWSDGSSGSSLNVNSAGVYWLRLDNGCQFYYDTINVNISPNFIKPIADTSYICPGGSINLNAANSQANPTYQWSNGSTSQVTSYNSVGNHWLRLNNSCFTDTFNFVIVSDSTLSISLGSDSLQICASNYNLQLQGASLSDNILWSTGLSQSLNLNATTSGIYWVRVTNNCGTYSDTLHLDLVEPPRGISQDTLSLCSNPGSSVTATARFTPFTQWLWSNGDSNRSTSFNTIGYHSLMAYNICDTLYDSVYVKNVSDLSFTLGPDTSLCPGESIAINLSNLGADSLVWENGSTSNTRNITTTGSYNLSLYSACGVERDTLQVIATPVLNQVLTDQEICFGDSIFIDASQSAALNYQWSNGDTNASIWAKTAGLYTVSITNNCDTLIDSMNLKVSQAISFNLGPDTAICEGDGMVVDLNYLNADAISWSDGSTDFSRNISNPGTYIASASNICGSFNDTLIISQILKPVPLLQDTTICFGNSANLDASQLQATSYLWSNGSTASAINVNSAGLYWVNIANNCDTITDSVRISVAQALNFSLGADTVFCQGGVKQVNLSSLLADSIRWSDGSSLLQRNLSTSGQFSVNAYNACGVFADTININVISPPQAQLEDTTICTGSTISLDASQNQATSYLWSNGSTASAINVNSGGNYWVSIRNGCDTLIDSVTIIEDFPLQSFDLGNDTIFCAGNITLDAGDQTNASYLWQDGSTGRFLTTSGTGTYYVAVENACGILRDTINVLVTGPPQIILGDFVQYCDNNSLTLSAQNPGSSYLWSTGATSQSLTITSPGQYWVTVTNPCGTASDTIIAQVESPPQVPFLQNDTLICLGDSIELNTGYPSMSSLWSDGSRNFRLEVDQAGAYSVIISNSCGNYYDTVNVSVWSNPQPFNLGADTSICANTSSISIGTSVDAVSYLWSTGATTDSISISQSGTYILTTTDFCNYTFSDTIIVDGHFPLDIDLGPDRTICVGDSIFLDTEINAHEVRWNDGFIGSSRSISEEGTYIASSTNACGSFSDTIKVLLKPVPQFKDQSFLFCQEDSLLLRVSDILDSSEFNFDNYSIYWEDGSALNERYFYNAGDYTLLFEDYCEAYPLNFQIETKLCICPLFLPNAFSPNGDGKNDYFGAIGDCELTAYQIEIFNRWGESVFKSIEKEDHWDGRKKGETAPQGTYFYRIVYEWSDLDRGYTEEKSGTLTLLR